MPATDRLVGLHVAAQRVRFQVESFGGNCAQVFLSSPRNFRPPVLSGVSSEGVPSWVHAAYVVNVASDDPQVRAKSRAKLAMELAAAAQFGARGVVVHPGSCHDESVGRRRWLRFFLDLGPFDLPVLLENSAGRGIAQTPEQVVKLANLLRPYSQVCLDTCHAWASGWEPVDYLWALERELGRGCVSLVHANDARYGQGSSRDGHAHLDEGQIGLDSVAWCVREAGCPAVCETPDPRSVKLLVEALGA